MTYSVYQHWDPLKVCIVGKSYPPELYDYIENPKVRNVFYQIAEETEEDYQKLISILEKFNVKVHRPDIASEIDRARWCINHSLEITGPGFMQPRDTTLMLGSTFFCPSDSVALDHIKQDIVTNGSTIENIYGLVLGEVQSHIGTNEVARIAMNGAMTTRLGKDLYIGTPGSFDFMPAALNKMKSFNPVDHYQEILSTKLSEYRVKVVDTQGHTDGTFCPVVPGLIVSILNEVNYKETFPGWEVIYLPNESWIKMQAFGALKKKNKGKWWVPGQELNDDFTYFVETWMKKWVGYVEESVFDVNMLVIDRNNVIVNGYNEKVFDAFSRYGITPHICNFRHRYFWDGGLHCITSDIHREGHMQDYFPERN